ncbi:hypothetical protein DBL67_02265 [Paenibacillus polymyxa]|nr:hypothetical protein DBL67_02265 [Paenibacillus polymyxa]
MSTSIIITAVGYIHEGSIPLAKKNGWVCRWFESASGFMQNTWCATGFISGWSRFKPRLLLTWNQNPFFLLNNYNKILIM